MKFITITEAEVRDLLDMLDYWPNYDEDDMIGVDAEERKKFQGVKNWATELLGTLTDNHEEARLNQEILRLTEELGTVKREKTNLQREYNHVKKTIKGLV